MDKLVELLLDNYIWLIVISCFLIFALIGFAAENSTPKPKKEKPKEKKDLKPIKETITKKEESIPPKEEVKPKKEKKDKKQKKDDILVDDTPTIGDLMKKEEAEKLDDSNLESLDID